MNAENKKNLRVILMVLFVVELLLLPLMLSLAAVVRVFAYNDLRIRFLTFHAGLIVSAGILVFSIIQGKRGLLFRKNIVAGIIVGSFMLFFTVLSGVSLITGVKLIRFVKSVSDVPLSQGIILSSAHTDKDWQGNKTSELISYYDSNDAESVKNSLAETVNWESARDLDKRWERYSQIPSLAMQDEAWCCVYNRTTGLYNQFPVEKGLHEIVFVAFFSNQQMLAANTFFIRIE